MKKQRLYVAVPPMTMATTVIYAHALFTLFAFWVLGAGLVSAMKQWLYMYRMSNVQRYLSKRGMTAVEYLEATWPKWRKRRRKDFIHTLFTSSWKGGCIDVFLRKVIKQARMEVRVAQFRADERRDRDCSSCIFDCQGCTIRIAPDCRYCATSDRCAAYRDGKKILQPCKKFTCLSRIAKD